MGANLVEMPMNAQSDFPVWKARVDALNAAPNPIEDDDESDLDEAGIAQKQLIEEAILAQRSDVLKYMVEQSHGFDKKSRAHSIFISSLLLNAPRLAYLVHEDVDLSQMKNTFQNARFFESLDGKLTKNDPSYWQAWEECAANQAGNNV